MAGTLIKRLRALLWYASNSPLKIAADSASERITFVCGSNDPISLRYAEAAFPDILSESFKNLHSNVRLVRVEQGYHFLPLSHPSLIARIILDMLNDVSNQFMPKTQQSQMTETYVVL